MSSLLTILGGGGWFPAHGRHTACALLRDGEHGILIDAGTGVARLVERPELLDGVTRLDIVLTHFHLDHISGLAYLPAVGLCEQTTLWGPGRLLYGTATSELIGRVSNEPFHPVPLDTQDIAVRDLTAREVELAGVRLALREQSRHSAPTLGLRFDDRLAWLTDTAFDPDSAPFASGCQTLAHEAWFASTAPRNPEIHSSAAQAAQVARDAGSARLLLTHLPPFTPELDALLQDAAGAGRADATLAIDGLRLTPTG
ncbi:MAG TPA: MBL fold metallo-hydrolase [Solirubrobacteraceae bacterium]|nr:MBL fold metallo-hydrolase [Solirubrobacteraceae bacterium]